MPVVTDAFTALAAEIFRKYNTDGVPASGLHKPDLDEVRQWGTDVETAFGEFGTVALLENDQTWTGLNLYQNRLRIEADGTYPGAAVGPQLVVGGKTNTNQIINIGYDTTNNYTYWQGVQLGAGYRDFNVNPEGGNVAIGKTTAPTAKLDVNGSFTSTSAFFPNNATIQQRSFAGTLKNLLYRTSSDTLNIGSSGENVFFDIGSASVAPVADNTASLGGASNRWATIFGTLFSGSGASLTNIPFGALASGVVDTDATLSANSDTKLASQKAIKSYVDNVVTGLKWKASVACRTTANITLSGEQAIDGVTTSGSRVLVGNQSTASQNGLWVSAAGAWTRATDADTASEITGATVLVERGTTYADTIWTMTTDSVTLGTTSLSWAQVSGAGTYSNGTGLSLSGNVFSIDSTVATSGKKLSFFAATSSAELAGVISDETGTGPLVFGTNPSISGGTHTALTSLGIRSTGAAFDLTLAITEVLTASRTLTFRVNDTARTIDLSGNFTLAGAASLPAIVQGDLWYGSAAGVISALAKSTSASRFLKNSGTSNNPAWAQPAFDDLSGGTAPAFTLGGDITGNSKNVLNLATLAVGSATAGLVLGSEIAGINGPLAVKTTRTDGAIAIWANSGASAADTSILSIYVNNPATLVFSWEYSGSDAIWFNSGLTKQSFRFGGLVKGEINSSGDFTYQGQLYGPNIATTASAANAFIDTATTPAGQLKRSTSSGRYKRDVRPLTLEEAEHAVRGFEPIIFRSKAAGDDPLRDYVGLIAEDVASVDDRFIERFDGRPEAVQYDRIVAPLLVIAKEFLAAKAEGRVRN